MTSSRRRRGHRRKKLPQSICCWVVLGSMVFASAVQISHAINWLATDGTSWNRTEDCASLKAGILRRQQRSVCSRHVDMMSFVSQAARVTVDLCQQLFAERRWNCSSILLAPKFHPDLTSGGREQAFVYALSSASLVHAIAKACSTGLSSKCHCASASGAVAVSSSGHLPAPSPPPEGYQWGGCADDIVFASDFAEEFTDRIWKRRRVSRRSATNLHNSIAGRRILASSMRTMCKCHGVSGACTVRTCWRALPVMRSAARIIERRHSAAVEVRLARRRETADGARRLVPAAGHVTGNHVTPPDDDVRADELVYYTISPDYCLPDKTLGSVGTKHRECRPNDDGSSGCRSMCCGRGHVTLLTNITRRCDCKYYWCCYVRCNTCQLVVQTYRCR